MSNTPRQQRTIAKPTHVDGFGYWSGRDIRVEFRPASPSSGLVFVRGDLDSPQLIPAVINNRIEAHRRTNLSNGGASVEMVEHVMAALAGMQVDNCEIWVDSAEMPGFDGSSQPFVDAIQNAGIVTQNALRPQIVVTEETRVGNEDNWVEARPSQRAGLQVKYRMDYGSHNPIGRQTFEIDVNPDTFQSELARARTFLFKQEADWLREQGHGTRVTYRDLLVFDEEGPIENELRFENECVRHKTLDLVGDLALAGCDFVGQITAYRSGHRLNADLVSALLSEYCLEYKWCKSA